MKEPIVETLKKQGVKVRTKDEVWWWRAIGKVFPPLYKRYWTTMTARTIWAPAFYSTSDLEKDATTIRHELVHAEQARKYPFFWQLGYLIVFFPVFFAYVRWVSERWGYMVNIREGGRYEDTIEWAVDSLWNGYAWPWPKPLMRRWFLKQLKKEGLR